MNRPSRSERLAAKGRPKRRAAAAKAHFFKYQLATNPSRAEENDLKRALQESLEEQDQPKYVNGKASTLVNGGGGGKKGNNSNNSSKIISSTNSSDVSTGNISFSSSNGSISNASTPTTTNLKRTRSGTLFLNNNSTPVKRAKLNVTNGYQTKCDGNRSIAQGQSSSLSLTTTTTNNLATTLSPYTSNKAIKTYSKSQPSTSTAQQQKQSNDEGPKSSTPIISKPTFETTLSLKDGKETTPNKNLSVSKSTQTPSVSSNCIVPTFDSSDSNSSNGRDNSISNSRSQNKEVRADISRTTVTQQPQQPPVQGQYLKFKRESKNYAIVKMTALKVSTSKSPSSSLSSKSTSNYKKSSQNQNLHSNKTPSKATNNSGNSLNVSNCSQSSSACQNGGSAEMSVSGGKSGLIKNGPKRDNNNNSSKSNSDGKKSPNFSSKFAHQNGKAPDNNNCKTTKSSKHVQGSHVGKIAPKQVIDINAGARNTKNDCSLNDTVDLSMKNQNQANVKVTKKRLPQGSWSLLGVPEEKVIYLRDDEPPKRLICYPAIKHIEGDVIQVRDSVLLRSGARKTDLPYIAKVCAFWEDAETGGVMMSLFWYYRPEHTEEGRRQHHLSDEIFASRHRDVDSVECIEDKCYVLTFNEYCRYRKRCKMEQVDTTWSLTDVTIPVSNESYPRRNRIPDSDVNPELVFCCRQIYDSRMRRLVKNPLINPKYGHI